jgi:hypothetical protein
MVTGFLGKVCLVMLLDRYPEVGKVHVLVRPRAGGTAEERFFGALEVRVRPAPCKDYRPLFEPRWRDCRPFTQSFGMARALWCQRLLIGLMG